MSLSVYIQKYVSIVCIEEVNCTLTHAVLLPLVIISWITNDFFVERDFKIVFSNTARKGSSRKLSDVNRAKLKKKHHILLFYIKQIICFILSLYFHLQNFRTQNSLGYFSLTVSGRKCVISGNRYLCSSL